MSLPPDIKVPLNSETLKMVGYTFGGYKGYWLYDRTRSMNLAMRAETPTDALVEALHYYQRRLKEVENEATRVRSLVDKFVDNFIEGPQE